jgi:hypothetical protein
MAVWTSACLSSAIILRTHTVHIFVMQIFISYDTVPECQPHGSTVLSHMQPRLAKLQSLLDVEPVSIRQRIGRLCNAIDYQNFRMVVGHRDMALENILVRGRSIAPIIDREFMAFEPEFVDALYFSMPENQKIWGKDL